MIKGRKPAKCICGYGCFNDQMSSHSVRCSQYQAWKKMIIDDPHTTELVKKKGIAGAARELGLSHNSLRNWFQGDGTKIVKSRKAQQKKELDTSRPKSETYVELTTDQILCALRSILDDHDKLLAATKANIALNEEVSELKKEVEAKQQAITRLVEQSLTPFKVRIEREMVAQAHQ